MNFIDRLVEQQYIVLENFIDHSTIDSLRAEAELLYSQNKFHIAGIGRNENFHFSKMRRSDYTYWIDFNEASDSMRIVFLKFLELKKSVNRELYLGLFSEEFHFAYYPPGGFYESHMDAFKGAKNRLFSVVLFLNKDWSESDGGCLRIEEKSGKSIYIKPEAGTLVGFLSEEISHEVCETYRDRWSLTGWFRCRED